MRVLINIALKGKKRFLKSYKMRKIFLLIFRTEAYQNFLDIEENDEDIDDVLEIEGEELDNVFEG
jgi:hypothetical protein